jgi:nucleotide-binding universal stress UspA family protein
MGTWKRICVPIDLSEASRSPLRLAASVAHDCGAELLVLHVTPHPAGPHLGTLLAPHPLAGEPPDPDAERFRAWVREAERLAPGVVTGIELSAPVAERIIECAEEMGCDLIVLGAHARGLGHLVSVADRVLRAARCPVLVTAPDPG